MSLGSSSEPVDGDCDKYKSTGEVRRENFPFCVGALLAIRRFLNNHFRPPPTTHFRPPPRLQSTTISTHHLSPTTYPRPPPLQSTTTSTHHLSPTPPTGLSTFVAVCTAEIQRQIMLFRCDYDPPGHFRRTVIFPAEVNCDVINSCVKGLSGEDPPMFPEEHGYIHPGPLSPDRRCLLDAFNEKMRLEFDGNSPLQMFTFLRRCNLDGTVIETFPADARRVLKQSLEFWGNEEAVVGEFGRMFRDHDQYLDAIDEDERQGMWDDMER